MDQACSVKMAGYWPHFFFTNLWTSTPSLSISMQKKNLANFQPSWPHTWSITHIITWLAPWAGKMNQIACCGWLPKLHLAHSGLPAVSRKQNFTKSHIINPLLTKFVRSRWLDIGLILFWEFMHLDFVSVHKHAKKEQGQYPAILTEQTRVVNNPYYLSIIIIVLIDILKDYSPKPTTLCIEHKS